MVAMCRLGRQSGRYTPGVTPNSCSTLDVMDLADAKWLKSLEKENAELKKMLAESMLENRVLKEVNAKENPPSGCIYRVADPGDTSPPCMDLGF